MLRINLLPIRQLQKRAKAKTQLVSFVLLFVFLLLILGSVSWLQASKAKNIETSISSLKREKQQYAPILAKIKELQQAQTNLNKKIDIIRKLERESSLTVHVLDEVAHTLDSSRVWLTSLTQQGNRLTLAGIGLDNRTVAQFMDGLKYSPYISTVDLSNSSQKIVAGRNLKIFDLSCTISPPQANEEDSDEPKH